MFNVTLVSGEGSVGKSTLLMQLSGSTVLGKGWIGMIPAQGPVLYVSCEEDHDELRRRAESRRRPPRFNAPRDDRARPSRPVLRRA
jgi:RecA-family ATPase